MSSEQHVADVITHNRIIEALARAEKGPSPGVCELSSLVQSASGLQERCPIAAQDVTKFGHVWSIRLRNGFHTLMPLGSRNCIHSLLLPPPISRTRRSMRCLGCGSQRTRTSLRKCRHTNRTGLIRRRISTWQALSLTFFRALTVRRSPPFCRTLRSLLITRKKLRGRSRSCR